MKSSLSLEPLDERAVPAVLSTSSVVAQPEFARQAVIGSHPNPEPSSGIVLPGTIKMFNPQPEPPMPKFIGG